MNTPQFSTASRYALTVYRCPNDRLRWWLELENTVTGEHEVVAGHRCACHKRPERVRTWGVDVSELVCVAARCLDGVGAKELEENDEYTLL